MLGNPGAPDGGLGALAFVYALVPCALKLGALLALSRFETAARRELP